MHPTLNIAIKAARSAGNIIVRAIEKLDTLQINQKQQNDFVTEVDHQAEKEIMNIVRKAYPDHGFLAEESGRLPGNDYTWIIDPLDGTTNFIHNFPHFAVSIAVMYRDKLEHAVIYDPIRQELFTSSRGKGAQLNDRRIRVTQRKNLDGALLGTGFPFKNPDILGPYLETLQALSQNTAGIRRAGAATLDLAYVAAGRLDGFWEAHLNPWDIAAGALLIKEAGGLVSDFSGGERYLDSGNIVAGNPKVLKAILQVIGSTRAIAIS